VRTCSSVAELQRSVEFLGVLPMCREPRTGCRLSAVRDAAVAPVAPDRRHAVVRHAFIRTRGELRVADYFAVGERDEDRGRVQMCGEGSVAAPMQHINSLLGYRLFTGHVRVRAPIRRTSLR
jgi:hypothetical protein